MGEQDRAGIVTKVDATSIEIHAMVAPDSILQAEFQYIAQTAFQANEDRARVANLYLVTIAGLIAAFFSAQADSLVLPHAYWGFALMFAILGLASILTLLQLIRLREAWFQSVNAMNQIKFFYVQHLKQFNYDLEPALAWSNTTLPSRFKPWSISFLLALQVSLIGGTAFGTSVIFVGVAYNASWWWVTALLVGVCLFGLQMLLYWRTVRR